MDIQFLTLIIFAYFLGAVPFGFLIGKAHGKDLRLLGSGNIGATNATRALGKKWGYLCLLLDVLKGLIPMLLVPMLDLVDAKTASPASLALWLLVGCAAVLGHVFPVYLKFKGGKGVATSLGIVLGLWPYFTFCGIGAFVIWLVTLLIWRTVSLSSILAAISFPITLTALTIILESWEIDKLWPLIAVASCMALLIVLRHKTNIKRLLDGSELKIGHKD
jgi:glycerol-3-phosphate acyltransferase PlsY